MIVGTRVILTYKDYEALPADGRRYELHDGELCVTPAPSPRHQEVSGNLWEALRQHVRARGLGKVFYSPIDCLLSETTIVQPDIVYVAADSLSIISARAIEGPPTLVIEVVSPSTTKIDRGAKLQLYARYGVPYYWIVEPDLQEIVAYALRTGTYDRAGRLVGAQPVALPPLRDLLLDPASLWP